MAKKYSFIKQILASTLCGTFLLGIAMPASAQISSVSGPVPFSDSNPILGPSDVAGAKLGIGLKSYGYIEEEYFVQGEAAAYERTASGLKAHTGKLPYTTRIVIRRPADPAKFSGVIHFEPIHPTHGYNGHWLVLSKYLMSRGDIYVFAGVGDANNGWSGSPYTPIPDGPIGQNNILKWFNPERYSAINFPEEEGIRYEVMADIGRKLRSKDGDNPLRQLDVKAMLVGGWSYTGSIQRTFINEGFHELARLEDGKPVFDGYLVGVSSSENQPGYLPLYNDEPFVPIGDPRRTLKSTDARVIEFLTEAEVEMAEGRKEGPDSDEYLGGRRVYEFAGVIHVDSLHDSTLTSRERPNNAQMLAKGYKFTSVTTIPFAQCSIPQSNLPQAEFVRGAVENLRRWVLEGTPPPRAERITLNGKEIARDNVGNALGGIRMAELDVPLARYGRYLGDDEPACKGDQLYPNAFLIRDPLTREELISRYGSAENYVARYDARIEELIQQRWLLSEDGLRLKAQAREYVNNGF